MLWCGKLPRELHCLLPAPELAQRAKAGHRLHTTNAGGYPASLSSLTTPISPLAPVCVPPQSSVEKSPIFTTRTFSPYFSPKSAMAWYSFTATSMGTSSRVSTLVLARTWRLISSSTSGKLFVGNAGEVGKIKAQMFRIDPRAGLLHVLAQNLAQGGMQQMRAGMVAANRRTGFCIHHGIDIVAQLDGLAQVDLVRADALHRLHATQNIGDDGVVVVGIEPAGIPHLAAGVGIKRGVVEHDLDALTGVRLGHADAIPDDGEHFAMLRGELAIAFEDGLGQRAEGRAGRSLRASLPGGAGARLLFGASVLKAGQIEIDALVAGRIHHEVKRQAVGLVEMEGGRARQRRAAVSYAGACSMAASSCFDPRASVLPKRSSSARITLATRSALSASSG